MQGPCLAANAHTENTQPKCRFFLQNVVTVVPENLGTFLGVSLYKLSEDHAYVSLFFFALFV